VKYSPVVQFFEVLQVFERQAGIQHFVDNQINWHGARGAVVVDLFVPVAVPFHGVPMNLIFAQLG
jgi:hypothetical protein